MVQVTTWFSRSQLVSWLTYSWLIPMLPLWQPHNQVSQIWLTKLYCPVTTETICHVKKPSPWYCLVDGDQVLKSSCRLIGPLHCAKVHTCVLKCCRQYNSRWIIPHTQAHSTDLLDKDGWSWIGFYIACIWKFSQSHVADFQEWVSMHACHGHLLIASLCHESHYCQIISSMHPRILNKHTKSQVNNLDRQTLKVTGMERLAGTSICKTSRWSAFSSSSVRMLERKILDLMFSEELRHFALSKQGSCGFRGWDFV